MTAGAKTFLVLHGATAMGTSLTIESEARYSIGLNFTSDNSLSNLADEIMFDAASLLGVRIQFSRSTSTVLYHVASYSPSATDCNSETLQQRLVIWRDGVKIPMSRLVWEYTEHKTT